MLFKRIVTMMIILVFAGSTGCLSTSQSERAFSHDWADKVQREKVFQAREEYVDNKDGTLIKTRMGRALVKLDKEGKPRFNLFNSDRLRADLKLKGGKPAGKVKYEIRW